MKYLWTRKKKRTRCIGTKSGITPWTFSKTHWRRDESFTGYVFGEQQFCFHIFKEIFWHFAILSTVRTLYTWSLAIYVARSLEILWVGLFQKYRHFFMFLTVNISHAKDKKSPTSVTKFIFFKIQLNAKYVPESNLY
jgi:hypothetical protein